MRIKNKDRIRDWLRDYCIAAQRRRVKTVIHEAMVEQDEGRLYTWRFRQATNKLRTLLMNEAERVRFRDLALFNAYREEAMRLGTIHSGPPGVLGRANDYRMWDYPQVRSEEETRIAHNR